MNAPSPLPQIRHWFRRLSVRRKLSVNGVAIAILAAFTVSLVFGVHQFLYLRAEQGKEMLILTQMMAENATGPVAFADAEATQVLLSSLRAKTSIRTALIHLPDDSVFALYGAIPPNLDAHPAHQPARYRGWHLHTYAPIGQQAGHLHLIADLRPALWSSLRAYLIAFTLALILAIGLSQLAHRPLSRFVLAPVEALHAASQHVALRADYTHRAQVFNDDELGELTAAFNRMLDRLQASDRELRTANESLSAEINQRRKVEGQLIESSRLAGMAQVATGVLHNVGNVLNSVNISTRLIRDSLAGNPRFNLLRQTGELLHAQGDALDRFIAEDPRGRLVPRMVAELASEITTLRTELLREADLLAANIEHIKQIVATQQSYAKSGGLIQTVEATDLIEEALRITQPSLDRHSVVVDRQLAPVPRLLTDRHQVLQILINFITNAIHALKPMPAANRRLRLRLEQSGDRVRFDIEDNGVGIAPADLQRIFTHGFTTRKDGHGFGLHSGALAAHALGGKLRVESDGQGLGARFSLELPVVLPSRISPT